MCGIIARAGPDDAVEKLIGGLESLEYRGYDSAGVAVRNGSGIEVCKRAGEISEMRAELEAETPDGTVGIGHTRWSTHGPPTDANAHPHTCNDGSVAVVHNGVIENHQVLRERLRELGHEFTSDTDTEVVPHLFEHYRGETDDAEAAFRRTVEDLEGSYAIAALVRDEHVVYGARQGSPLVVGLSDEGYYLASDVPAFLEYTDDVLYLEDDDVAVLEPARLRLTTVDGEPVSRESETVEWDPEEVGKGGHDHYMRKEILEQPTSLANTVRGRIDPAEASITFEDLDPAIFADLDRILFVACGTSYHAAMFGDRLFGEDTVPTRVVRASEFAVEGEVVDESTLVVGVTQSGETADTLTALGEAATAGARTLAVTNVMGSTAAREADEAVFIRAGPEIGVAATKTFSSQAVTLTLLSQYAAEHIEGATPRSDLPALLSALESLPEDLERLLAGTAAERLARNLMEEEAYFFIGRGLAHPVALEGALKFKEITYEHAEGFASGQLKHGPLALVTSRTPVFALFTGEQVEKTVTNAKEAQTRGADVIAVGPEPRGDVAVAHLPIPETHPVLQGLLANVQLQLVSYHVANELERSIDKPRNLAKSVTVE